MAFGIKPFGAGTYAELSGFNPAARMSAFNFCNPFDHILPPSDGTVSALDRQHLWGMYIGIVAGAPADVVVEDDGSWYVIHRAARVVR